MTVIQDFHANTDNNLKDQTEYTFWMGRVETLNLDIFTPITICARKL